RRVGSVEVFGVRPVRGLRCADLSADGGGVDRDGGLARGREPFQSAATCVASGTVCVLNLHHRAVIDGPRHRPLIPPMSDTATRAELGNNPNVRAVPLAEPTARKAERSSISVIAVLITLATAALAGAAGWAMWTGYMGPPGQGVGRCRACVGPWQPRIEGRIAELPGVETKLSTRATCCW